MSESPDKIKIGILGLGGIAKNHIKAIEQNSHLFDLMAVCDKNARTLSDFNSSNDLLMLFSPFLA